MVEIYDIAFGEIMVGATYSRTIIIKNMNSAPVLATYIDSVFFADGIFTITERSNKK
jgi:FMN-dependent NADH-azoreductase